MQQSAVVRSSQAGVSALHSTLPFLVGLAVTWYIIACGTIGLLLAGPLAGMNTLNGKTCGFALCSAADQARREDPMRVRRACLVSSCTWPHAGSLPVKQVDVGRDVSVLSSHPRQQHCQGPWRELLDGCVAWCIRGGAAAMVPSQAHTGHACKL